MDYSLIHDRDLSLANNYNHNNPLGFGNSVLTYQGWPHVSDRYANKQYSAHGTGLPIFLLPGFIIAKARGAIFEMILVATAVVWLTWVWTKQVTKNRKVAYIAAFLLVICYFFNGLSGAIYPDMLMAGLTLITLIAAERYYKKSIHQLLIGITLGFLVLVHLKAIVIVGPALLVLSYKLWKSDRKLPWITIITASLFVIYYFLTLHQWFGVWSLSHVEGGQSFSASPKHNISAMLFDANRGLLVYNPILLLIFIGLPVWFKKHRDSLIVTLIALLPSIILLCMIPNWNGSASPTGRYIIAFLPAFIPAIAFAIEKLTKTWQRLSISLLGVVTFLITLDATFNKFPQINNDLYLAKPILFDQIQRNTGLAIDRLLPAYSNTTVLVGKHGSIKLMADYLIVLCLLAYGIYLSGLLPKRKRSS